MWKSLTKNLAILFALLVTAGFAYAEEDEDGSVSGFVSAQAAIHDGVYPLGSSDIGTDMGIAFTRSLQYVELRGMLTSTREGDFDNGKVRVSYLYADLGNGGDGIRVGRCSTFTGSAICPEIYHISQTSLPTLLLSTGSRSATWLLAGTGSPCTIIMNTTVAGFLG